MSPDPDPARRRRRRTVALVSGRRVIRITEPVRRRRPKRRIALLPLVGLGVGAGRAVYKALDANWSNAQHHPDWVLNGLSEGLIGYDFINKHTTFTDAFITYGLTLVGYIAHKFLNYLGINRHMPDRLAL
jgi:hypothetical protein